MTNALLLVFAKLRVDQLHQLLNRFLLIRTIGADLNWGIHRKTLRKNLNDGFGIGFGSVINVESSDGYLGLKTFGTSDEFRRWSGVQTCEVFNTVCLEYIVDLLFYD